MDVHVFRKGDNHRYRAIVKEELHFLAIGSTVFLVGNIICHDFQQTKFYL